MKIFAFADPHGDLFALEKIKIQSRDADLIVCLGDITYFEHDLDYIMELLNDFPRPVLLLHGNHEFKENVELLSTTLNNINYAHKSITEINGFSFISYGGDGFSDIDTELHNFLESDAVKQLNKEKTIFLLHGPPYQTKLDIPYNKYHSGNKTSKEFITKHQPLLVLAGHIHECEGKLDYVKKSILFNPGPNGILIDLNDLHKARKNNKKITINHEN